MTLTDAKNLVNSQRINTNSPQQWADLGCGDGLFTRALLSLLHRKSIIHAIDKQAAFFTDERIRFSRADFEHESLSLPLLNGMIMANSLHFVIHKLELLQKIKEYLLPGALFILVEYNTQTANRWVPFPVDFPSAAALFKAAGFEHFEKINDRPSIYNRANIYAAHGINI